MEINIILHGKVEKKGNAFLIENRDIRDILEIIKDNEVNIEIFTRNENWKSTTADLGINNICLEYETETSDSNDQSKSNEDRKERENKSES